MTSSIAEQPKRRGNRWTPPQPAIKQASHCHWCKRPILWARKPIRWGGRWVALDPEPDPRGNYAYLGDKRCLLLADHSITTDPEHRRSNHESTCGTTKVPAE